MKANKTLGKILIALPPTLVIAAAGLQNPRLILMGLCGVMLLSLMVLGLMLMDE